MRKTHGKTYTHAGKPLTAAGWAADPDVAKLGLIAQAIYGRIDGGWSVEDALTTPKGAPRPATSEPKKSTKPRGEEPRKAPVQRAPRKREPAPEQRAVKAGYEAGKAVARVRATLASKQADAAEQVCDALTALPPAELLTHLGYVVEDAGVVPAGRLLLIRGAT